MMRTAQNAVIYIRSMLHAAWYCLFWQDIVYRGTELFSLNKLHGEIKNALWTNMWVSPGPRFFSGSNCMLWCHVLELTLNPAQPVHAGIVSHLLMTLYKRAVAS